jgi:hypothetical protein
MARLEERTGELVRAMTASPREGACEACPVDELDMESPTFLRKHHELNDNLRWGNRNLSRQRQKACEERDAKDAEIQSLRAALGEENDLLLELRKHRSVHRFAADRIDKLNEKARALLGKG